jgi:hypothetical protein
VVISQVLRTIILKLYIFLLFWDSIVGFLINQEIKQRFQDFEIRDLKLARNIKITLLYLRNIS